MKTPSVVVIQCHNPKFRPGSPEHLEDNPRFVYQVEKTTNTINVSIDQWLTPRRVTDLIDMGTDVVVTKAK